MRRIFSRCVFILFGIVGAASAAGPDGGHKSTVRGWVSDEGCASGRAKAGAYTGTNPDCAKRCVHDGKRVVLVDSEHKRLLVILNQAPAMENVGDYVEINGDLNEEARTLHIDSLKLLEKGRAMCDVPKKKSGT